MLKHKNTTNMLSNMKTAQAERRRRHWL